MRNADASVWIVWAWKHNDSYVMTLTVARSQLSWTPMEITEQCVYGDNTTNEGKYFGRIVLPLNNNIMVLVSGRESSLNRFPLSCCYVTNGMPSCKMQCSHGLMFCWPIQPRFSCTQVKITLKIQQRNVSGSKVKVRTDKSKETAMKARSKIIKKIITWKLLYKNEPQR